jgi:hypothetical protein
MIRPGTHLWKALRGASILGLIAAYLLAATQFAFPIREWMEARNAPGHRTEIYACSIHKCQCQNALQCRTRCCCFPKASDPHAHGDEGGLQSHWAACGGSVHEDGLMPPLPDHAPASGEVLLVLEAVGRLHPESLPLLPSPIPQPPLKVPILLAA